MDLPTPEISLTTLGCGLKVVSRYIPQAQVECMGVAVDAGSRDDPAQSEGVAHFVEHTIFKGTPRRRASYILNRMEAVGGELNAYTTKESTMVYALAPAGNLQRGATLIAELVQESSFPSEELERERDVVADEIDSYLDTPSDAVMDDFEEMIFRDCRPLSHNILGDKESLLRLDSLTCRRFLEQHYTPENMVFFYSGPEKADKVIKLSEKIFTTLGQRMLSRVKVGPSWEQASAQKQVIDKGLHQSHTVMGTLLPGLNDHRRTALSLLANVAGGPGMNSLLNVALRERRGLVYSVDASVGMMSDVGTFSIYFGCDREDYKKCARLTDQIMRNLAENGLTPTQLAAAKKQGIGQMILASQNPENSALAMARSTLYHGQPHTLSHTIERIESLTTDEMRAAASLLHPDRYSSLTFL